MRPVPFLRIVYCVSLTVGLAGCRGVMSGDDGGRAGGPAQAIEITSAPADLDVAGVTYTLDPAYEAPCGDRIDIGAYEYGCVGVDPWRE